MFPDDVGHDSGVTFHDHFAGSPLHHHSGSMGMAGSPLDSASGTSAQAGAHANGNGMHGRLHSSSGMLNHNGTLHHSHSFAAGQVSCSLRASLHVCVCRGGARATR